MRRTFPRIPGSPQATPSVETPAHYAPTLFNGVWLFLSEVVNGNVEPTMSCTLCRMQVQNYINYSNSRRLWTKILDFCGILWGNGGRLGVKDVRRGLLWSDCGAAGGFDSGLRGAVGMNGRRGGMEWRFES